MRIDAVVSFGNLNLFSIVIATRALKRSLSKTMLVTRPTTTPALFTGARGLSPPMLSKFAVHRVGFAADADARHVADLHREHQQRADAGADEQSDPQVERRAFHHTPRNMNEVKMKSRPSIASDEVTTVRVVAPDTPSAVGGAS